MGTQLPTHLMGPGSVVQSVRAESSTLVSSNTQIPIDDTIPQVSEGVEILSLAITPKSIGNFLSVVVVTPTGKQTVYFTAALFRNGAANSVRAAVAGVNASNTIVPVYFDYREVVVSLSPVTFTVRCGTDNGGNWTLGGLGGVRHLGGVQAASIVITEVAA